MAHRIELGQEHEGATGATGLRSAAVVPLIRPVPAPTEAAPSPSQREVPNVSRRPMWDKNNFGFWLAVCVAISLVFSIVYRALGQ